MTGDEIEVHGEGNWDSQRNRIVHCELMTNPMRKGVAIIRVATASYEKRNRYGDEGQRGAFKW